MELKITFSPQAHFQGIKITSCGRTETVFVLKCGFIVSLTITPQPISRHMLTSKNQMLLLFGIIQFKLKM